MEHVADHLRATWSTAGLEVRGCGTDRVHVAVGPGFPMSQLCADAAAVYDAEVCVQHDSDSGTTFVVVPHKVTFQHPRRCCGWLCNILVFAAFAVGIGVSLWAAPTDKLVGLP